jgi:hypothetical protein
METEKNIIARKGQEGTSWNVTKFAYHNSQNYPIKFRKVGDRIFQIYFWVYEYFLFAIFCSVFHISLVSFQNKNFVKNSLKYRIISHLKNWVTILQNNIYVIDQIGDCSISPRPIDIHTRKHIYALNAHGAIHLPKISRYMYTRAQFLLKFL